MGTHFHQILKEIYNILKSKQMKTDKSPKKKKKVNFTL